MPEDMRQYHEIIVQYFVTVLRKAEQELVEKDNRQLAQHLIQQHDNNIWQCFIRAQERAKSSSPKPLLVAGMYQIVSESCDTDERILLRAEFTTDAEEEQHGPPPLVDQTIRRVVHTPTKSEENHERHIKIRGPKNKSQEVVDQQLPQFGGKKNQPSNEGSDFSFVDDEPSPTAAGAAGAADAAAEREERDGFVFTPDQKPPPAQ